MSNIGIIWSSTFTSEIDLLVRGEERVRLLALLILLILAVTPVVSAQQFKTQAEVELRAQIPALIKMRLVPKEIIFTREEILSAREESGRLVVQKSKAVLVEVVGNIAYGIYVAANTSVFSGPQGEIPVERLEWRYPAGDEGAPWTPLSIESTEIFSQDREGSVEFEMDLRLTILMTDPVGLYQGTLLFTLGSL